MYWKEGILERPIKKYHGQRDQTADKAFDTEQRRLDLKKDRLNDALEHRKTALFGSPTEKKALGKQLALGICEQRMIRKSIDHYDSKERLAQYRSNDSIQNRMHQEYLGRRAVMKQTEKNNMFENLKMIEDKKTFRAHEKKVGIEIDKQHIKAGPYAMSINPR